MHFLSRKRQRGLEGPSLRQRAAVNVESERASDPARASESDRAPTHWAAWRGAAQNTARAWQEWTASDAGARPELYRRYVCALTDEAQAAAALERALEPAEES